MMSHKINCIVCYCELKSDEMIYEDYREIDNRENGICEECHVAIHNRPLITKGGKS